MKTQTTYFVNVSILGGLNSGSSWENAFSNLQSLVSSANDGDFIWVAKGIYYPTATSDRTISFILKQGVKVYGGFVGVETSIDQRNWDNNKTILSGDIGILNFNADNTFHIIHCVGVDSMTLLNGFYITKSMADGAGSNA